MILCECITVAFPSRHSHRPNGRVVAEAALNTAFREYMHVFIIENSIWHIWTGKKKRQKHRQAVKKNLILSKMIYFEIMAVACNAVSVSGGYPMPATISKSNYKHMFMFCNDYYTISFIYFFE